MMFGCLMCVRKSISLRTASTSCCTPEQHRSVYRVLASELPSAERTYLLCCLLGYTLDGILFLRESVRCLEHFAECTPARGGDEKKALEHRSRASVERVRLIESVWHTP
jgi:hypothetical protein